MVIPVLVGEDSFTNSALPLSFDASLTVVPGLVSAPPRLWTFMKSWFGPSWRNFWIYAAVGVGLFLTGVVMVPSGEGRGFA